MSHMCLFRDGRGGIERNRSCDVFDLTFCHPDGNLQVWLTDVVTLLSGRMTVSQVLEDLHATIALVTRP